VPFLEHIDLLRTFKRPTTCRDHILHVAAYVVLDVEVCLRT
jgi:hypothetical protein